MSFFSNPELIKRGKNRFEIFCTPCHGFDGKGKGTIITNVKLKKDEEGFPPPADLTTERTQSLSNERLYHILNAGQNLMYPVNFKLNDSDRIAVILYLRSLKK